jgi:hypothetical protein
MLSVGRLLADGQVCGLGEVERRQLVERLGLFGIRLAVELLRRAPAMRSSDLSAQLLGRSGLLGLRELLLRQFGARAQVLKARSALALLAQLARTDRSPQGAALLDRVRTVELSAHELRELALLQQLRQPGSGNGSLDRDEVARLLGDEGAEPWRRLALDAGASQDDIRTAALEQIGRWRSHAEDPIVDGSERDLARAVVRSCEGIVAELPTPGAG